MVGSGSGSGDRLQALILLTPDARFLTPFTYCPPLSEDLFRSSS